MLKWTGLGFLAGIPARDLEDDEIDMYGGVEYLLETGLYTHPEGEKPAKMVMNRKNKTTLTEEEEKE